MTLRFCGGGWLVAAMVSCLGIGGTTVIAQEATFLGPRACARCHSQDQEKKTLDPRDFCRLDEFFKWDAEDRHSKAYETLDNELSKKMVKRLGWEKAATEDQRCLSCHANWLAGQPAKPLFFEKGVTCESCHGPSSLYEKPHAELDWRKKTPADKAKLGMIDVRNPGVRAKQCLACHLGNVEDGKVLTHEMYAAGHPPLPSFEIEAFSIQTPPHWRTLDEKSRGKEPFTKFKTEYLDANFPNRNGHDPSQDLNRSKGVLLGGVMTLHEAVRFTTASIEATTKAGTFPELAAFDCAACHHELRSPNWRQHRPILGAPGRPLMPQWSTALVKVAVQHAGGADGELQRRLDDLQRAIGRKPFGDAAALSAARDALLQELSKLMTAIEQKPFAAEDAERVWLSLQKSQPFDVADFHGARQIGWAMRTIQEDVAQKSTGDVTPVMKAWDRVTPMLVLDLPTRLKKSVTETQKENLRTQSEYRAREFLEHLKNLPFSPRP